MKIRDNNIFLGFGMLSLTLAILIGRYFDSLQYKDFIEGLLYGISITSNFVYLIKLVLNKNK